MLIDLHVHTTASDGQYSPAQIVEMSAYEGISVLSVTDHDTINGLKEAAGRAEELKVRFVPGIEISTKDIEEIHILGYDIDQSDCNLKESCDSWRLERTNRGIEIRDYLKQKGIEVDLKEVNSYAENGNLGRPHFARYLIEHGYVKTRRDAFDRYLDTNEFREATDRKKPSCEEAIRLIHGAGGKAVLAHPGIYRMGAEELEDLIFRLAGFGLNGIECFYSKHTTKQTNTYLELMRRFSLKTSCGSDYHGDKVKPDTKLGMLFDRNKYISDCVIEL